MGMAPKEYPDMNASELNKSCFCTAYITSILRGAFGLKNGDNYEVIRNVHGVGIDWALGFVIEKIQHHRIGLGHGVNGPEHASLRHIMMILLSTCIMIYFIKVPNAAGQLISGCRRQ